MCYYTYKYVDKHQYNCIQYFSVNNTNDVDNLNIGENVNLSTLAEQNNFVEPCKFFSFLYCRIANKLMILQMERESPQL